MQFNIKLFFKQLSYTLTKSENTPARLTPKRFAFLLLFFPVFTLTRFISSFGLALDDVFYKDYKDQKVSQPVFIVGNPRSGTTYIHRLLARDTDNFSVMKAWEVVLAPSVIQRKFMWFLQKVDVLFGNHVRKWIMDIEEKTWFENPAHKISLFEADEDEAILINIWETIFTTVIFPHPELVRKYAYFDKQVSRRDRRKIMRFYRSCLRRHLFARNSDKKFLSKNPTFSPKVDALYEFFPDAKIILMIRNPLDTVPSAISWMSYQWRQFADPREKFVFQDYMLDLTKEWYEYPLERLAEADSTSYAIVNYEELTADPKKVISGFYENFGFEISPSFDQILDEANQAARDYKSKHKYSLQEMGLSKDMIIQRFRKVFDRFGFDTR